MCVCEPALVGGLAIPNLNACMPVDSSTAAGTLLDTLLLSAEFVLGWWVLTLKMRAVVSPVPPRTLRALLEASLSVFPGNATFLSLYTTSEEQAQVGG